ncbi:LicD family protein [bacterium]|nr:LicD family protein [bacterium]
MGLYSIENIIDKKGQRRKIVKIFGIKMSFKRAVDPDVGLLMKEMTDLKLKMDKSIAYQAQLKFFLDTACDITKCKPATGNVRLLQDVRAKALKLLIPIFEKYNIEWWIDFGSLLGVYRHKGFIPWDTDVDVTCRRTDYMRLYEILKEELPKYNMTLSVGEKGRAHFMKVADKGGLLTYLDIFPFDTCNNPELSKKDLHKKWASVRTDFYEKYFDKLENGAISIWDLIPELERMQKYAGMQADEGDEKWLFRGIDSATANKKPSIHLLENLYPLQKGVWEGIEVNIPNKLEEWLHECEDGIYGDLMTFPTSYSALKHQNDFKKCANGGNFIEKLKDLNKFLDELLSKSEIK